LTALRLHGRQRWRFRQTDLAIASWARCRRESVCIVAALRIMKARPASQRCATTDPTTKAMPVSAVGPSWMIRIWGRVRRPLEQQKAVQSE
jgi:hypothetical protein